MSVREEVEEFVEKRPYIQQPLAEEIVNYSALARKIEPKVDGGFEAVKMSLHRYQEELKERRRERQVDVTEILGETTFSMKNNVKVCKSEVEEEAEVFSKTESGFTSIQTGSSSCDGEVIEDQVMISLESPETLEDTPGVLAFLLSVLAGREINLTEVISCREDTHIVLHEDDATEAFELLNEKLK